MLNFILKCREKKWINIFVIYLRYLIGGAFAFSAIPKISGLRFTTSNSEAAPINSWMHFFETLYRSGIYWEFLGWGQLIAALILMSQKYATLGALLFLPIILNVFVITVSYQMTGTIVITSLMLVANIFLVLWDFHKISFLFSSNTKEEIIIKNYYDTFYNHIFWSRLGILLFVTTDIYVIINDRNPTIWFLICCAEGLIGFFYMNKIKNKIESL